MLLSFSANRKLCSWIRRVINKRFDEKLESNIYMRNWPVLVAKEEASRERVCFHFQLRNFTNLGLRKAIVQCY